MQTSLLLDIAADACDDRIAVGSRDGGLTYAQMRTSARAAAAWLASADTQHAVFIGLNGPAMPVLLFGSGIAGLPFVPINYRLSDEDLRKLVARTVPATVVVDDDMAPRISEVEGVEIMLRSEFDARFVGGPVEEPADLPEADNDIAVLIQATDAAILVPFPVEERRVEEGRFLDQFQELALHLAGREIGREGAQDEFGGWQCWVVVHKS